MKKRILFIVATHGNEPIGLEAIIALENRGYNKYFDILIANPLALKNNQRFIDIDLNRSYPGNPKSRLYEQKIAANNLKTAQKYEYVIDIHEASEGYDDFIIIPKKKLTKRFPIAYINLSKLLLWPNPKGPISQILNNSIELEFGSKNRNRLVMIHKCTNILENFIRNIYLLPERKVNENKKMFYVYGKMAGNKVDKSLVDFKKTIIKEEEFYPLLTNQYIKDGILCYKMKSI